MVTSARGWLVTGEYSLGRSRLIEKTSLSHIYTYNDVITAVCKYDTIYPLTTRLTAGCMPVEQVRSRRHVFFFEERRGGLHRPDGLRG